jgi:hypothetical protein
VLAKFKSMKLQLEALQASLSASFEATMRKGLDNRNVHVDEISKIDL